HIHPGDRVHGIVTHGGEAPNVVPAHTEAEFINRAATVPDLEVMRERLLRCVEARPLATRSTLGTLARHGPYAWEHHHQPTAPACWPASPRPSEYGVTRSDSGELTLPATSPLAIESSPEGESGVRAGGPHRRRGAPAFPGRRPDRGPAPG